MRNGAVPAERERTRIVEGNVYFPPETVNRDYLRDSPTHTVCGWKGTASDYDVMVDGQARMLPGTSLNRAGSRRGEGPYRLLARCVGVPLGRSPAPRKTSSVRRVAAPDLRSRR